MGDQMITVTGVRVKFGGRLHRESLCDNDQDLAMRVPSFKVTNRCGSLFKFVSSIDDWRNLSVSNHFSEQREVGLIGLSDKTGRLLFRERRDRERLNQRRHDTEHRYIVRSADHEESAVLSQDRPAFSERLVTHAFKDEVVAFTPFGKIFLVVVNHFVRAG